MKSTTILLLFLSSGLLYGEETGHPAPAAAAELPDGSLYALSSTWTDQDGKDHRWGEDSGKARVLAMGYSTCQGICPRIIADMRRIEAKLKPAEREKVRFTFLSVAPETDGVPELKTLAENHKLDTRRWQVMRNEADAVLEMAVALGIQYSVLPNGVDYAHSYLIAIVAPDGRVVHKWVDPGQGPDASVAALRQSLAKAGNMPQS